MLRVMLKCHELVDAIVTSESYHYKEVIIQSSQNIHSESYDSVPQLIAFGENVQAEFPSDEPCVHFFRGAPRQLF